jgi:hypothetical protein
MDYISYSQSLGIWDSQGDLEAIGVVRASTSDLEKVHSDYLAPTEMGTRDELVLVLTALSNMLSSEKRRSTAKFSVSSQLWMNHHSSLMRPRAQSCQEQFKVDPVMGVEMGIWTDQTGAPSSRFKFLSSPIWTLCPLIANVTFFNSTQPNCRGLT